MIQLVCLLLLAAYCWQQYSRYRTRQQLFAKLANHTSHMAGSSVSNFAPFVRVSGQDGGLDLVGDYIRTIKTDIYGSCSYPKYQKLIAGAKQRKQYRALSVMAYDGGRWVFAEWSGVLLEGPLIATNQGKSPDQLSNPTWKCTSHGDQCRKGIIKLNITAINKEQLTVPLATLDTLDVYDEPDEEGESEDDGFMYTDRQGYVYCSAHRRELCHVCCVDHRDTNEIWKLSSQGEDVDTHEISERNTERRQIEDNLVAELSMKLGRPITMQELYSGSSEAQRLYDQAMAGIATCAHCGARPAPGARLMQCSKCKLQAYCGRDCQVAHWPQHKKECKAASTAL